MDSRDGLSHDCVYNIIQDDLGYLWFATENGLDRYDGVVITTFKHNPLDPLSLAENDINVLVEDGRKRIWIGTWGGGVDCFDPREEVFHHIEGPADDGVRLSGAQVLSMITDSRGDIWVGTWESGIFRITPDSGLYHFHVPGETEGRSHEVHVWNIVEDPEEGYWVATQRGLYRFDDDGVFHQVLDRPAWVRALCPDRRGDIYFSTTEGINRLRKEGEGFDIRLIFPLPEASMMLTEIFFDHRGVLWAGTRRHGLICLDPVGGSWKIEAHDEIRPESLSNNNIRTIMEDSFENLWVGTRGNGVNRLDLKAEKFLPLPIDKTVFPSKSIWAFIVDHRGDLWIGTDAGLGRFPAGGGPPELFLPHSGPGGLSYEKIRALAEDSRGNLWVGTRGGGLNRLGPSRSNFTQYRWDPGRQKAISSDNITVLFVEEPDTLWVGTDDQGLDRLDLSTGEFEHHFFQSLPAGGNRITAIFPLGENVLMLGTDGGCVVVLDTSSGTISHVENPAISSLHILSIARGPADEIYLGTRGGLEILDDEFRVVDLLTEKDGLPDNTIYGILRGDDDRYWMTTNRGLASFCPGSGLFRCYGVDDGLVSMGFNEGAAYRGPDGTVYVGGPRGGSIFRPSEIKDNPHPPRLVITRMAVLNGDSLRELPLDPEETIRIPHRENSLLVDWVGMEFTRPRHVRFEYRLEGFDSDWIAAKGIRQRRYTNLGSGRYVFELRACNSDGVFSETIRSPEMEILRPFWLHPLFILGIGLLSCVLLGMIYRILTRRIRRRNRELEELMELRSIAEEKANRYARELEHSTLFDTLTALPNRALVSDRIRVLLSRCRRDPSTGFAVVLMDLDQFRLINDSMGHRLGDELLCRLTDRLRTTIRTDDTLGRLGGDEFIIILHSASSVTMLEEFATRIHECFREPFVLDGREVFMTTSIGMVTGCAGYENPEELMRDADTALYRAKKLGRGRHVVFDPGMHLEASSLLKLENDLRRGIENGQFLLYYQPIIDLREGRLSAFEALLRWRSPDAPELRSPADFLDQIRRAGLAKKLGSWVLDECCRQAARWNTGRERKIGVAANLFVQQVLDSELPRQMQLRIRKSGCTSSMIHLEITEEVLIDSPESAIEILKELRSMGFGINLDDFGSGFSSLSYLQRFPVDIVKIDRSFITSMLKDANATRIVEAVILLAHGMGKRTIAEGIETADVAERLLELGCDFGQGYYFSRPISEREAEALLETDSSDWMGLPPRD